MASHRSDYGITQPSFFPHTSTIERRTAGTISSLKSQARSYATDIDDDNLRALKLNLPQQYEVTIN